MLKIKILVIVLLQKQRLRGSTTVDTPTNAQYAITSDKKEEIEYGGFTCKFKEVENGASLTGKLEKGEKVITLVYKVEPKEIITEYKGNVVVHYVDENGKTLNKIILNLKY